MPCYCTSTDSLRIAGLSWRFVPKGNAAGDGTLYVQDVKKGTDTLDSRNDPIAVNQHVDEHDLRHRLELSIPGPAIKANAKVAVVVADANGQASGGGDIQVYDDRGSNYGGLAYVRDHHQAAFQVRDGFSIAWSMDYNIVTQQQVYTLDSGKFTGDVYLRPPTRAPTSTRTTGTRTR